jgi:putative transposase
VVESKTQGTEVKMSTKKIKRYENSFKARVVLDALRGDKTINEVASEHQIIPYNIKAWKRQFLENMDYVFDKERAVEIYKDRLQEKEELLDELYKQIGKLNTQLEWAKKKSREAGIEY